VGNIIEFVKNIGYFRWEGYFAGWGLSHTISILINANLVNEIILPIHPVILGNEIPLFKDIEKQLILQLLGSNTFKSGSMQMHYAA
jgi:dihydrofolate reductase